MGQRFVQEMDNYANMTVVPSGFYLKKILFVVQTQFIINPIFLLQASKIHLETEDRVSTTELICSCDFLFVLSCYVGQNLAFKKSNYFCQLY